MMNWLFAPRRGVALWEDLVEWFLWAYFLCMVVLLGVVVGLVIWHR